MIKHRRDIGADFLKRCRAIGVGALLGAMLIVIASTIFAESQTMVNDLVTPPAWSAQAGTDDSLMPLPANLETGLPLRVVSSPFRMGRLSLISVSAYQGYDSNPSQTAVAQGTEFSSLSGLIVYSLRGPRWNVDLQYEPSLFVSPKLTAQNWTGNAVDFQAGRRLSSTWTLALSEHFRYSPNLQSSIQGNALSVNLGGGVAILTPFLSTSRSLLLSTLTTSLNHRISENSSLQFHADQSYVRISGSVTEGGAVPIPVQNSDSSAAGVAFNHVLGIRDSIEAKYDYRAQFSYNAGLGTVNFHTASLGWSHVIMPTVRLSVSGGPGWSNPGVNSGGWHTTAQGSLQLSKETRSGDVALAFSRSDVFAGVIGNGFNNHYALRVDRKFGSRLSLTATGSYIEQHFVGSEHLTGEMGSFEAAWSTTRNWSIFGQVRYLDTHGRSVSIAPQKLVTVGFRWSWVPQKP